jgi:hypothetical protein
VDPDALRITPIAHVWDEDKEVPAEVEALLTSVYDDLNSGKMKLPYKQFTGVKLDRKKMVLRDLYDVRWLDESMAELVSPDGMVMELTFDLGVSPETKIYAMRYDTAADRWAPVVSSVNNGDGTVTCVFEQQGVIAFTMPQVTTETSADAPAVSESGAVWLVLMGLATAAVVAVLVIKSKKSAK